MTEIINYRQLKETKQGLWRRFEKVKEDLITSLKPDQTPEVNRELEETIWNGFDSGIRDYYGRIDGVVGGINLNVTL